MQRKIITFFLLALFLLAGLNTVTQIERESRVLEIVDGDTIDVANGQRTERVRILGIDTPEIHVENNPSEFYLENTSRNRKCLQQIGEKASELAKKDLEGEKVDIVSDPESDRRGDYGRLLAYIERDGQDLGKKLLEKGYARVYNSSFSRKQQYRTLEDQARSEGRGIWNQSCGEPS